MRRPALAVLALTALTLGLITACSNEPVEPASAPPTSTAPTSAVRTPVAAVATADAEVCGDLERVGESFYTDTFAPMLMENGTDLSLNVEPLQLSAQLAALTTIGAETGQIDGAEAIGNTSAAVRTPMITMVRDADRLAQRFVDASVTGVLVGNDVTEIVTSFAEALAACTTAGYQPAYFDPAALIG